MILLRNITPRLGFISGFAFCTAALATAAWFQFVKDLEPCPLCISQRLAILLVGIIFLLAAVHNPADKGRRIYAFMGFIAALMGAAVSIRHVWLQNLPPEEVPDCGPGLEYVLEYFPVADIINLMLNGTGECAEVLWTFLGLSIPAWTLVAFFLLAAVSVLQFFYPYEAVRNARYQGDAQ